MSDEPEAPPDSPEAPPKPKKKPANRRKGFAKALYESQALDRTSRRTNAIGERQPSRRVEEALQKLEEEIGGREQVVAALHASPLELSQDQELLLGMLADPDNDRRSLAKLTQDCGMKVRDLLNLFRQSEGARAYLVTLAKVYRRLPGIGEDIGARSIPHDIPCSTCKGEKVVHKLGWVEEEGKKVEKQIQEPCETCNSTGKFHVLPDLDRQLVALKLGGFGDLLKSGAGVSVNVNTGTQVGAVFTKGNLKSFHEESDAALRGSRVKVEEEEPAVEAEVVDGSAGPES